MAGVVNTGCPGMTVLGHKFSVSGNMGEDGQGEDA